MNQKELTKEQIISIIRKMAQFGHPPTRGCSAFGYGFEDAIQRIKERFLEQMIARDGESAEKFVIGPYGSGKTQFCREILEVGDQIGFVTAEVQLNKNVDFTKPLIVYKELTSEIKLPQSNKKGMNHLLANSYERMKTFGEQETGAGSSEFLRAWISNLDLMDFELKSFSRIVKKALNAYDIGGSEHEIFKAACNWLNGDINNKETLKVLGESRVPAAEEALHGQRATISLFQFIKESRFPGTIALFDEAEQSFTVNTKKKQTILSLLKSGLDEIVDSHNAGALVLYALTYEIADEFKKLDALRQRLDDPIGGKSFFEGDVYAPKISLDYTQKLMPRDHLRGIGESLVDFCYQIPDLKVPKEAALSRINEVVEKIIESDISASNRRSMVKATCYILLSIIETGKLPSDLPPDKQDEDIE
jgi:hypothetical protein